MREAKASAHVCFAPKSGVRADIPGPPLWAKSGSRALAVLESSRDLGVVPSNQDVPLEKKEQLNVGLPDPGSSSGRVDVKDAKLEKRARVSVDPRSASGSLGTSK